MVFCVPLSRSLFALMLLLAALIVHPALGANKILMPQARNADVENGVFAETLGQEEDQQQRQRALALAKHRAEAQTASLFGCSVFATLAVGMLCFAGRKPTPASAQQMLASGGVVRV
eukprot:TRINITY_DN55038_c0_g1_i2.p3 TRINITY_DN55038_c0_g1~~TRINITY_DN55038_c0_g1_i2.p3  ORF type:complete len:117 (-),score=26.01 TRINITY_DN55038_c0_g1_i2:244-594(-)